MPLQTRTRTGHVCVIIIAYNSAHDLPALLESLPAGFDGVRSHEVIVVDNQSRDGSADIAAAHALQPKVIRMGRNAGYAAGINAAASCAHPNACLLLLNPDLRVAAGAIRPLIDECRSPSVGVALPRNLASDGTLTPTIRNEPSVSSVWWESLLGGKLAARLGLGEVVTAKDRYERIGAVEWGTGSAMLISPRARRLVGQWDESYFLYSEEVDFQRRVRRAGLQVRYVPQAQVVHHCGKYRTDPRLYALLTTNRIRYFQRHHTGASTLLFRLGLAAGEVLRLWRGPVHRGALACALLPLRPALSFRA